MDLVLVVSVEMMILALEVIIFLSYIGYDMRARGFKGTYAVTVMHQNGVSFSDYFRKKKNHPILEGSREYVKMSKLYLLTFIVGLAIMLVFPLAMA